MTQSSSYVIARSVSDDAIQFFPNTSLRLSPSLRGALAFLVIARSVSDDAIQFFPNTLLRLSPSLREALAFLVIARSVSDDAIRELHTGRHHGSTLSKQRYHQISWINSAVHQRLCNKKTMSFPGHYCQLVRLLIKRQLIC